MYLNVSQVAAAIGKNRFVSRELIQLEVWAQVDPIGLAKYLHDNRMLVFDENKAEVLVASNEAMLATRTAIQR